MQTEQICSWDGTRNTEMNPEERDQNLTENAFIHAHELLSAKFRRQLSCKYSAMMGENAMFSQLSQFRQKTQ